MKNNNNDLLNSCYNLKKGKEKKRKKNTYREIRFLSIF